jgi:hypothetical protein
MKRLMLFAALAFVACNSCVPAPTPVPPPAPTVTIPDAGPSPIPMGGAAPIEDADAGPEPDVDPGVRYACRNAAALGCPEAKPIDFCLRVTQRVLVERLTIVPLNCMVGARTKTDMQHCGFIGCK